jgi:hypothetical protein
MLLTSNKNIIICFIKVQVEIIGVVCLISLKKLMMEITIQNMVH